MCSSLQKERHSPRDLWFPNTLPWTQRIRSTRMAESHGNKTGCQTYHHLLTANKEYHSYHPEEYKFGSAGIGNKIQLAPNLQKLYKTLNPIL